jgi:hypothetical protein
MRCYPADGKFHSALYETAPTSAAGLLVANDGRVVAIDNRSGHYQPGYLQLYTAVDYLHTNQLFEPDAFVSVHVSDDDALYFSPEDFLEAAKNGMSFRVVASLVHRRAEQFHNELPVAENLAFLIPKSLQGFPTHDGRNRWDRMLTEYYGGDMGLETIVKDLRELLKEAVRKADNWKGQQLGGHASEALKTFTKIRQGGVYCQLPELVDKLMMLTQPTEVGDQTAGIWAHIRYKDIADRLDALKPARQTGF